VSQETGAAQESADPGRNPDCDWILTVSGRKVWPTWPADPGEIALDDIAHALSQINRWTGHTRRPWSVAQHALVVAEVVAAFSPDLALAALHHDDAEAYLGDVATPIKRQMRICYRQMRRDDEPEQHTRSLVGLEDHLLATIFERLQVKAPSPPEWEIITRADRMVLRWEAQHLMPSMPDDAVILTWPTWPPLLQGREPDWDGVGADRLFLERHRTYGGAQP
jgi:uncharacterized protein